jgi:hypothetical protein
MMLPGSGTDNGNKALVIVIGGLHSSLDSDLTPELVPLAR